MKIRTNNLGKERYEIEKVRLSYCVDVYVNKLYFIHIQNYILFYHNNVLDLQLTVFYD